MSAKCIDREDLERRRTCARFINQPLLVAQLMDTSSVWPIEITLFTHLPAV